MKLSPVVIVLAAGRGTRFSGQGHKLAQPLAQGSVLGNTLSRVRASCLPFVVVTVVALQAEVLRHVSQRDTVLIGEAEVQQGMARSIVAGVQARAQAPGDMPLVQAATLNRVADALPGHACVVPFHGGRRGHPVGFAAELYSELVALSGDEGARRLLLRYPACEIDVDDDGILFDVDTEKDLLQARERV